MIPLFLFFLTKYSMSKNRKRYAATFKTKAVLDILSNQGTLNEVASKYQIDSTMLSKWKHAFLDACPSIFEDKRKKDDKLLEKEVYIGDLEKKVGQLTIERDWLKKKSDELLG